MLPSTRLILLVFGASPLFLAGALVPAFRAAAFFYLLLVIGLTVYGALRLPSRKQIHVSRRIPERISVGVPTRIVVDVENRSRRTLRIALAENITDNMAHTPPVLETVLRGGQRTELEYRLTVNERGRFALEQMDIRLLPLPGVLWRQFALQLPGELHVYPNLMNIERYKLLTRKGLSQEQGLARLRHIGLGSDFESLRTYVSGDDVSRIEWKATAKRNELIVKNYQPERRQNVVVAIDVGRIATGEFKGLSYVDYMVNAALMLAYVTLRQKDRFSLVAFSDRIESYLPPIQGLANIERVSRALYHVKPRLVESDYDQVCRFLSQKHRKRSLLCIMTDVLDAQASGIIISHMSRLRRYHLPLLVALANSEINQLYERPLGETESLYTKAVAIDVKLARREALVSMRQRGISVLDVTPDQLTAELINRYIQIKTRHLL